MKVLFGMVLPSCKRSFIKPFDHEPILLLRLVPWALALDLRCGFWRARAVSTVVALSALVAKARISFASSVTKPFPTAPMALVYNLDISFVYLNYEHCTIL